MLSLSFGDSLLRSVGGGGGQLGVCWQELGVGWLGVGVGVFGYFLLFRASGLTTQQKPLSTGPLDLNTAMGSLKLMHMGMDKI